jgi:hypothetical protein
MVLVGDGHRVTDLIRAASQADDVAATGAEAMVADGTDRPGLLDGGADLSDQGKHRTPELIVALRRPTAPRVAQASVRPRRSRPLNTWRAVNETRPSCPALTGRGGRG